MLPFAPAAPYDYARRPDFLVISPPKTGSTWLADCLRRHPQLYVPPIKEVKYFSTLHRWLDFEWYCDHFASAGGRKAGEASPSYAALPTDSIRRVRQLLPDVKLVFLMRDPVSRAWSHAKHNRMYGEANFTTPGAGATDAHWRSNFAHPWPLASGDYLGQLRRWSAEFPPDQLYVGFYESIATRPAELLRDVFRFLGVDPNIDVSAFPLADRVLAGPPDELPEHLASDLRGLLRPRTAELVELLRDRFGLTVPGEWRNTLDGAAPAVEGPHLPATDEALEATVRLEESFASAYRVVLAEYRRCAVVFYRGDLYAVPAARGPATPEAMSELTRDGTTRADCLTAPTLAELKERIADAQLAATDARLSAAEAQLRALSVETERLRADVARLAAAAARPSLIRRAVRSLRVPTRALLG